jgi:hypothetical protein
MPKYRQLHVKILDSYDFSEMPDDFTRVFWLLLIVVVDSAGRAIDNPAWLRSKMFPLRHDVIDSQIESALSWLSSPNRKMIVRYIANGHGYFEVVNFPLYQSGTQNESKSVLPAPPKLLTSNSEGSKKEVIPSVLYCIESELDCAELDPESGVRQLSDRFSSITGIMPHKNDKWIDSCRNMLRAGVTPDEMSATINRMKHPSGKGQIILTVTGPWSCENMAISDHSSGGNINLNVGVSNG